MTDYLDEISTPELTVATNAKQLNLDEVEAAIGQLACLNYRTIQFTKD